LRGREAAEAIQADYAARDGRAAYFVVAPLLDCFALASLGLAMTEGRAAPRIPCGRRTVGCGCILDCFALASLGLAMTGDKWRAGSQ